MQLNPQTVSSKMQIPPQLQNAFQRIVAAGQAMLYSPEMQQQIKQYLQQPGQMDDKLAQGIAYIMLLLFRKSNNTMPPQLIIPASVTLLMDAADFLNKSQPNSIPNNVLGEATQKTVFAVLHKFGIGQQQAMQMMQNFHMNASKMNQAKPAGILASQSSQPAGA